MSSDNTKRSRNWVFTINIGNREWETFLHLKDLTPRYIVIGKEIGETGNRHFQGMMVFQDARTMASAKKFLNCGDLPHLEIMRGTFKQASDYCKEDGEIWVEYGNRPLDQDEKGAKSKALQNEQYKEIIDCAMAKDFESIREKYPKVFLCQIGNIQKVAALNTKQPQKLAGWNNWFIGGYPGTGKSLLAKFLFNGRGHYSHGKKQWWDNYCGEEYVLIDDLQPTDVPGIVGLLKNWLDLDPFCGEIKTQKGGTGWIRPKAFVITSNYSLRELFGVDLVAIERRLQQDLWFSMGEKWNRAKGLEWRAEFDVPKPAYDVDLLGDVAGEGEVLVIDD